MDPHDQPQWHRNQMVAALWRYTVTVSDWGADFNGMVDTMPSVFESRVKKMLNLDRIPAMLPWAGMDDRWAFHDGPGQGTGSEQRYSSFHVFMMNIAIELLHLGLRQSDIIYFLKHTRPMLREQYTFLHQRADLRPPISGSHRGADTLDRTDWMVIRRYEHQRTHPAVQKKIGEGKEPLFAEPWFAEGFDEVQKSFRRYPNAHRQVILIEIADPALALPGYLAAAPAVSRGRRATKTSSQP